jgi:hypothetical protein
VLLLLILDYDDKESQLTISEQGVKFKNGIFYPWSQIYSYTIVQKADETGRYDYLQVRLHTFKVIELPVGDLDKTGEEIKSLLEIYRNHNTVKDKK